MSRLSNFAFTTPGKLRLYSMTELLTLPPPRWLVDNLLPEGGVCALYGPPESLKSFMAIDLALCIASGRPWHGHAVQQGFALYVAAEGGPGISKRARAWLQANHVSPKIPEVAWLIESMNISAESDDMATLMQRLDDELEAKPKFVVLDTLARCLEGDESKAEDMGKFVAGMDHLRQSYGSTLLVLHHTGWNEARERGSTALRGGTDTIISVKRDQHMVTVTCEKQKDSEHFASFDLTLQQVADTDSCVLVDEGLERETTVLTAMNSHKKPLRARDLESLVGVMGMSRKTMFRALVTLRETGQIINENGLYHTTGVISSVTR